VPGISAQQTCQLIHVDHAEQLQALRAAGEKEGTPISGDLLHLSSGTESLNITAHILRMQGQQRWLLCQQAVEA
jgi:hypothetical protein